MEAKDTDIFISYRRIDGRDIARTIQLALGKEGFEHVFLIIVRCVKVCSMNR